jgi:hypothetical protein
MWGIKVTMKDILKILDGKWTDGTRPRDVYNLYVSKNPAEYIGTIIAGLHSKKRKIQNGSAEIAALLSEDKPEIMYPHIKFFTFNLESKPAVLRWEAVCTIGNLASVDKDKLIPPHIDKIASFLEDKSIVLQGHAVRALSKIAKAFPAEAPEILDNILSSKEFFPDNRIGFVIEAVEPFLANEELKPKVIKFIEPYTESSIKVVARKAKKALKEVK